MLAMRLFITRCGAALLGLMLLAGLAQAVDYKIEPLEGAADAEGLSEEIAAELAPAGIKVLKGTRTYCEIWPAKSWATREGFTPSASVLYPFSVGELMGVVRFKLKAEDFRGQEIPAGTYTLRYGLQPVDGNHAGTSPTRDFLVLLPIEKDTATAAVEEQNLFKLSAEVTGGTHPAMLLLLPVEGASDELPQIAHDEARELWSVRFAGTGSADGKTTPLPVDLVVVGRAAE